jgi:CBS domain-containing protein
MKEILVEQAMTPDPVTVSPDTSVTDVAKIMVKRNIGGLPVVSADGDIVGIVTESDLVVQDSDVKFPSFVSFLSGYVFVPGSLHKFDEKFRKAVAATAGEVMTENVITVDASDTAEHAATLMTRKKLKRFPVIRDGSLVGILTMADIVRLISRDIPVEGTED